MKSSSIIFIVIIAVIVAVVLYSLSGGQSNEEYDAVLTKEREQKDLFMKNNEGSPFVNDSTFSGLNYFPPDLKYRINAKLIPVENKKVVTLGTSDGLEQKYTEYAHAEFDLDGIHNRLLILEILDTGPYRGQLFLAFADGTSANETYGAGRYLDVKKHQAVNLFF